MYYPDPLYRLNDIYCLGLNRERSRENTKFASSSPRPQIAPSDHLSASFTRSPTSGSIQCQNGPKIITLLADQGFPTIGLSAGKTRGAYLP